MAYKLRKLEGENFGVVGHQFANVSHQNFALYSNTFYVRWLFSNWTKASYFTTCQKFNYFECVVTIDVVQPEAWSRGKNLNGFIIRLF